jgi:UDP-glucose 4-epimerase
LKILITGKNSFIGNSVKAWLNEKDQTITVDEISLRNINLNNISFKNYDVVLNVAGVAHISSKKKFIPEYYRVNRDLAINVAKKAKKEGVNHFIFTSSMAIYGDHSIGDFRPIDINKPSPSNAYGKSKLEADLAIQKLQDNNFNVSILRIPTVYGFKSKGNFPKLEEIAQKFTIFPEVKNIRSVINILSLSEFIRLIIINKKYGVLYPQDDYYFSTSTFIKSYRFKFGKRTVFIPFLKTFLKFLARFFKSINRIYGNKFYDSRISKYEGLMYQIENIFSYIQKL